MLVASLSPESEKHKSSSLFVTNILGEQEVAPIPQSAQARLFLVSLQVQSFALRNTVGLHMPSLAMLQNPARWRAEISFARLHASMAHSQHKYVLTQF